MEKDVCVVNHCNIQFWHIHLVVIPWNNACGYLFERCMNITKLITRFFDLTFFYSTKSKLKLGQNYFIPNKEEKTK